MHKEQATPLLITAHACLQHQTEPQMIIYLTVNGRHYRISKSIDSIPVVISFDTVGQMHNDAKAIAKATPYYQLITRKEKFPFAQGELMRLVLGLSKMNLIQVKSNVGIAG